MPARTTSSEGRGVEGRPSETRVEANPEGRGGVGIPTESPGETPTQLPPGEAARVVVLMIDSGGGTDRRIRGMGKLPLEKQLRQDPECRMDALGDEPGALPPAASVSWRGASPWADVCGDMRGEIMSSHPPAIFKGVRRARGVTQRM